MIERERSNIPLVDEFTGREWIYYDSYEMETKEQIPFQRHVDLRTFVPTSAENWTKGTYDYTALLARFPALALPVEKTTESESATPSHPVDFLMGFSDTDFLTFALPKFPLAAVNIVQSKIDGC